MAWRFEVLSLSRTLISWFEVKFDVWGGLLKLSFGLKVEVDVYSILELRLKIEVWSLELMFDVDFCSWYLMLALNLMCKVGIWSWCLKLEFKVWSMKLKIEIETWGWVLTLKHTVKDWSLKFGVLFL